MEMGGGHPWSLVTADLDTLLTALYVLIDDHVIPAGRRGPGRPKKLSDAELVCLAVAQVLLGARREHHWLRFCYGRLGHLFPYLPKQPGYHKRVKAAGAADLQAAMYLARQCPSPARAAAAGCHPGAVRRLPGDRQTLASWPEWPNYGYCASHSRWYWGLKLYLVATAEGMPVAWCLADPKLGERDVAAELLAHARDTGALRDGMILLGGQGPGRAETSKRSPPTRLEVLLVRPDRRTKRRRYGNLARMRQWIEAIFGTLKDQLSLERHGGRTPAGVFARIAQRLLALAAAIWHNWRTDAPRQTIPDRLRPLNP